MLSIDTMAATSSCRRTGAPEGGCSGLKLGRAEGHRTAATLPAVLRSSRILPGGQNDAYRSQKTVKVDGHLGNAGSGRMPLTSCRRRQKPPTVREVTMFSTFRNAAIGAAALALVVSLTPGLAHADLTVQDYQLGASFIPSNFSSFHYDGTNLQQAFTITPSQLGTFSGSIGPNLPGEFDFIIASSTSLGLATSPDGGWQAGLLSDFGTQG